MRPRSEWHLLDPDAQRTAADPDPAAAEVRRDAAGRVRRAPAAIRGAGGEVASDEALEGIAAAYAGMGRPVSTPRTAGARAFYPHRRSDEQRPAGRHSTRCPSLALRESIKLTSKHRTRTPCCRATRRSGPCRRSPRPPGCAAGDAGAAQGDPRRPQRGANRRAGDPGAGVSRGRKRSGARDGRAGRRLLLHRPLGGGLSGRCSPARALRRSPRRRCGRRSRATASSSAGRTSGAWRRRRTGPRPNRCVGRRISRPFSACRDEPTARSWRSATSTPSSTAAARRRRRRRCAPARLSRRSDSGARGRAT